MDKKIYYHLSHYISHKEAGLNYIAALNSVGANLVEIPQQADIIIIHNAPYFYPDFIRKYKNKIIIAYCVWETDILPVMYEKYIHGINNIWTCSDYSARSFINHGFNVEIIPHIVNLPKPSDSDTDYIKELVKYRKDLFYFYTIVDSINPRKNLKGLLQAFSLVAKTCPHARLIVKQYRHSWDLRSIPNVISISEHLPMSKIAALHELSHAYVSAHHAEAWGLSLSDAMSCGNPVIATGYSGNMHYMNEQNSFPVKYKLVPVSSQMCSMLPHFTKDMTWADIDLNHLAYLMRKVANGKYDKHILINAKQKMQEFSINNIGKQLLKCLQLAT